MFRRADHDAGEGEPAYESEAGEKQQHFVRAAVFGNDWEGGRRTMTMSVTMIVMGVSVRIRLILGSAVGMRIGSVVVCH